MRFQEKKARIHSRQRITLFTANKSTWYPQSFVTGAKFVSVYIDVFRVLYGKRFFMGYGYDMHDFRTSISTDKHDNWKKGKHLILSRHKENI